MVEGNSDCDVTKQLIFPTCRDSSRMSIFFFDFLFPFPFQNAQIVFAHMKINML